MSVATVLAVASITVLVATFLRLASDLPWFEFPLSAILAYGAAMLLILIARRIAPLSLPSWYFSIRPFEKGGRIYARLGVRVFRELLLLLRIDACNWLVRFSGRRSGLHALAEGARQAEADHVVSFLVVALLFVYALASGWYEVAGWLAVVNVVANAYPVMLQRHNRARIERVLSGIS